MQSINPECKLWQAGRDSKWRETAYFHWNGLKSSGKDYLAPILSAGVDKAAAPRLSTPPVGFSWHLVTRGTGEHPVWCKYFLDTDRRAVRGLFLWNTQRAIKWVRAYSLDYPWDIIWFIQKYGHSFLKTRNPFLMRESEWHGLDSFYVCNHKNKSTPKTYLQDPPM